MSDQTEYVRVAPLPVWPPNLGTDPKMTRQATAVPPAVYEFLKNPGDRAPLTGPFATREAELAAYCPL